MALRFIVGDMLTGRRLKNLQAVDGSWSEVLNDSGELSCTVLLSDEVNRRLDLFNSATVGKSFLAAVDGDTVLQAGPIWVHKWSADGSLLNLSATGMWGYFDHRVLLPVLAGREPSDPTTDTRYSQIISDEDDPGYPWASDTRASLTTIAKELVEQAQTWTNGDVPVVLPSDEAGTAERWYKGTDLAFVGDRLRQITQVEAGPDIMFTPRWTSDKLGIEWVMRIGTPTEPVLSSDQVQTFRVGVEESSVSRFSVTVDGSGLASTGLASGGKSVSQAIAKVSEDTTLTDAGYPALEAVDSGRATTSEAGTVQEYADALTTAGRSPAITIAFAHNFTQIPYLEAFNAGDTATVSVRGDYYLPDDSYSMRLLARSGKLGDDTVDLHFAPVVS